MKPIVIYNDRFLKRLSIFQGISGISLFPFIILKEKFRDNKDEFWIGANKRTINHETIHFWQTLELGIVFFYILYVLEFAIKTLFYGSKAYRNLSFEREAFDNDENLDYIKTRRPYSWVKRIIK